MLSYFDAFSNIYVACSQHTTIDWMFVATMTVAAAQNVMYITDATFSWRNTPTRPEGQRASREEKLTKNKYRGKTNQKKHIEKRKTEKLRVPSSSDVVVVILFNILHVYDESAQHWIRIMDQKRLAVFFSFLSFSRFFLSSLCGARVHVAKKLNREKNIFESECTHLPLVTLNRTRPRRQCKLKFD